MDPLELEERLLALYRRAKARRTFKGSLGEASNPCGDRVVFSLREEGGRLRVSFEGRGCVIALSSAEVLAGWAEGKSREEALALDEETFFSLLPVDLHRSYRRACALVPFFALKRALEGRPSGE